ncbi:MAG TPA: hypothetical protein VKV20_17430 [Ktedonobacteraceae bacterium]|jgi:DNA-directed RNA polymerase specialized sigma24 family protein|nr:hypothetical protein [Ktedonobacteraceae bacterium]
MKATAQEYDFHQRILARDDPIAFAQLAEALYAPLVQDVGRRAGSNCDATLVEESVGQALLDYQDKPERYDPGRAGLRSYLAMAAYRDFQNARAKEQRITRHQVSLFDPNFQEQDIADSLGIADMVEGHVQAEALWQIINRTFPDARERRIVTLLMNGIRSPEPYARVLGLSDGPEDERLKQVQLVKNRITRRLRRRITQELQRTGGTIS